MAEAGVQSPQLDKRYFVYGSGAVGGAVQRLIVHQYGDSVGGETQVQLHSSRTVSAGLKAEGRDMRRGGDRTRIRSGRV